MMIWAQTAVVEFLLFIFWAFAPGVALALVLRVRSFTAVLIAPVISGGILGLLAVAMGWLGIPWFAWSALVAVALVVGLAWLVRYGIGAWRNRGARARVGVFAEDSLGTGSLVAGSALNDTAADGLAADNAVADGLAADDAVAGLKSEREIRPRNYAWVFAIVGIIIAAFLNGVPFARGMGSPHFFAQSWDAVFHLNISRSILETFNASSFHINALIGADGVFYPSYWYILAALIARDSVVVSTNVVALGYACIILPTGLTAVARQMAPRNPIAWLLAPIAGTMFLSYPAYFLAYGVWWPNGLAYAMVPSLLALTILLLRRLTRHSVALTVLGFFGTAGLALAQPNALIAYAIVATPVFLLWLWAQFREARARRRELRAGSSVLGKWLKSMAVLPFLAVAAWFVIWWFAVSLFAGYLNPFWGDELGFWNGVWAGLSDANDSLLAPRLGLVIAVAVSIMILYIRRINRWLVFGYFVLLILVGLTYHPSAPLSWVTQVWWTTAGRIQGGVVIVAALIISMAFAELARWIGGWAARRWQLPVFASLGSSGVSGSEIPGGVVLSGKVQPTVPGLPAWQLITGLITASVMVFISIHLGPIKRAIVESTYVEALSTDSIWNLVSADEITMLERLGEVITDDGILIGSPWNGSALAYAYGGVPVIFPHFSGYLNADQKFLKLHFAEIHSDPEVCAALGRLGAKYFYTDTHLYQHGHPWQEQWAGLLVEAPQPGFDLIATGGTASVYRITACTP